MRTQLGRRKTTTRLLSILCPGAGLAFLIVGLSGLLASTPPESAPPLIPALPWVERSDWINVRTDVTPAAIGDGRSDDTFAIQQALAGVRDGSVLYFPPGTYRITAPLTLRNPAGSRWIGGLVVGSGRDTKLVWSGPGGGTMLTLDGMAYTRFVGLTLDGHGKAAVGFHYQSTQGFQTEVTHRHLAFRGFTNAAVLEDHSNQGQALAETTFENCLFENCERGVAFLQFNDYDFTFDGCEFRECGVAIDCNHGNFYVRNCHFARSRLADIRTTTTASS